MSPAADWKLEIYSRMSSDSYKRGWMDLRPINVRFGRSCWFTASLASDDNSSSCIYKQVYVLEGFRSY